MAWGDHRTFVELHAKDRKALSSYSPAVELRVDGTRHKGPPRTWTPINLSKTSWGARVEFSPLKAL